MTENSTRPGAPKGNTNALKHGYYSPRFKNIPPGHPNDLSEPGLTDEIKMLREVIRRVYNFFNETESPDQLLRYLSTLSLSTAQLSRLIKTQRLLVGEVSEIEHALFHALHDLDHEDDPVPDP